MKRILSVLLALLLMLTFVACSTSSDVSSDKADVPAEESKTEASEEKENKKTVGGEVVISHWGGTTGDAMREAYFNDFEAETGIKVVEVASTNNRTILETMKETGVYDIDLMQGSELEIIQLGDEYLGQVDYSQFDKEYIDGLGEKTKNEFGVGIFGYSSVLAYSTEAFPNEESAPKSWADFWDVENFPGPRALMSGVSGDYPPMEYGVLASGVSMNDLYPLDIDLSFEMLEKIAPNIEKWCMAGADAPQMLVDGEVVMAEAFSGRIQTLINSGAPVAICWNEGRVNYDYFLVPEECPNYENAMLLLNYMCNPERQAKFAELTGYGPPNEDAFNYMSDELAAGLATSPENLKVQFEIDNAFWAVEQPAVIEKWYTWEENLG